MYVNENGDSDADFTLLDAEPVNGEWRVSFQVGVKPSCPLTLFLSKRPKLHRGLAVLNATGLSMQIMYKISL